MSLNEEPPPLILKTKWKNHFKSVENDKKGGGFQSTAPLKKKDKVQGQINFKWYRERQYGFVRASQYDEQYDVWSTSKIKQ